MPEFAYDPTELPEPSAGLVLFRVHVEALVVVLGRKKAERYIQLMAEKLAAEENLSAVFHIRPTSERAAVHRARKQAAAMFERLLPIWLARIPTK